MKFLVLPHKVHHQDLSSHGLNDEVLIINFQKEVIDKFLLDNLDRPERELWEEQLDEVKLFFVETYVLNINGLTAGESLGVLLSFEEFTRYSVKVCFRLVSEAGTPIACGYQKLMLRGKWDNKPRWILRFLAPFFDVTRNFPFQETLVSPSFSERIMNNDLEEVFSHDVSTIGVMVTQLGNAYSSPKVVESDLSNKGPRNLVKGRGAIRVKPKGVPVKPSIPIDREEVISYSTPVKKITQKDVSKEEKVETPVVSTNGNGVKKDSNSSLESGGNNYKVGETEKIQTVGKGELIDEQVRPSDLGGELTKSAPSEKKENPIPIVEEVKSKMEETTIKLDHPPVGEVPVFVFSEFWANQSWILKEVFEQHRELSSYFERAETIINDYFGVSLKSMLQFETYDDLTKLFKKFPDFDQVCIFLSEVLLSKILLDKQVVPGAILGYGFGEIPGLVVSGACSFENGVKIVCERIKVLKDHAPSGKMLVVPLTVPQIKKHIAQIEWLTVEVASVNGVNQVILSGKENEILYLQSMLATKGVRCTPIRSVYPFHSSFLEKAAEEFTKRLEDFEFKTPVIPLYHASNSQWLNEGVDVKALLSDQLKQQLSFVKAIDEVYKKGYRQFIGCSGNKTIPEIIENCVPDDHNGVVTTFANKEEGLIKGVENILGLKEEGKFKSDIFPIKDFLNGQVGV